MSDTDLKKTKKRLSVLQLAAFARTLFVASVLIAASACTNPLLAPQHQSIKAVVNVKVTDPLLRQFTEVTTIATIKASGEFNPGVYTVKGAPITIEPDTRFSLELSVPVGNPSVISTENATGKLCTTVPLNVKGFNVPQCIVLANGKASGDVDVVRTLGAYLLNIVSAQSGTNVDSDDVKKMIRSLLIEDAALQLKPGSTLVVGNKEIHIGTASSIELSDVTVDSHFNYRGKCNLKMNFEKGTKWTGERFDCNVNGGGMSVLLNAERKDGELKLSLPDRKQKITLEDCVFRWGKDKQSSTHSTRTVLALNELLWRRTEGSPKSALHVLTTMNMENTHLDLLTDAQETDATFPAVVPCTLQIDIDDKGHRLTQFDTHTEETAAVARIDINRPTTKLSIYLANAKIGPISIDHSGELEFSLSKGTAKLRQLDWSSGKHAFTLVTAGASVLSLPAGMELSVNKASGQSRLSLPIVLKLGSATLKGTNGELHLADLDGKMLVTIDGDVRISSNMNFSIEKSSVLGLNSKSAVVHARGLNLAAMKDRAVATIQSCSIDWPHGALRQAIKDQLPKEKVFTLNKVFQDQHWRYRNATIKTVRLTNLRIDDMKSEKTNLLTFIASGGVAVDGSIDKGGLLAAVTHKSDHWETLPWSASAQVTGSGTVKYKLVPGTSLSTSIFAYDLGMKLPIPDDMQLDWSGVSHGLLSAAEKMIIVSQLKKLSVPVNYSGKLNIGDATETQWKNVKINHLVCEPSDRGTKMDFTAEAAF